jgi:hypothetical protein
MAGAGVYSGPATGPLVNVFAPIVPRRMGFRNADPYTVVRPDAVTMVFVPGTSAQATLRDPLPDPTAGLRVEIPSSCPAGEALCGFGAGMTLLVFDEAGHFDLFTVTNVQPGVGQLQARRQGPSHPYQPGAAAVQAETHQYYFDAVNRQLRHYDGYLSDVPVVDNVAGLEFEYFGDPQPPTAPRPPLGTANCLYDSAGAPLPGLAILSAQGGSLAELPLAMLGDGPWCGHGDNRFDADLLRVRRVRGTIRVQAGPDRFRGVGGDYAAAGDNHGAWTNLPDITLRFDVTPRNANLGR